MNAFSWLKTLKFNISLQCEEFLASNLLYWPFVRGIWLMTTGFPSQRASILGNVSMSWHHHATRSSCLTGGVISVGDSVLQRSSGDTSDSVVERELYSWLQGEPDCSTVITGVIRGDLLRLNGSPVRKSLGEMLQLETEDAEPRIGGSRWPGDLDKQVSL